MGIKQKNWFKRLGWIGVALCGLCCALPVIGAAVGIASLTVLSFYLEKIAITFLSLAAFFFWYGWYSKRKKHKPCTPSCDTKCDCKEEPVIAKE